MVSKALDSSEWSSCEQTPLKDNLVADLKEEKKNPLFEVLIPQPTSTLN